MLDLDGQVHHDTHAVPMGNYVIEVGNYVIATPSELGNYKIADTRGRCWIRRWAGPVDARVRDLIVAETRGNPLALLELPRGLAPTDLAGGFGLPATVSLPGRIEDSFRRAAGGSARADPAAAGAGGGGSVR